MGKDQAFEDPETRRVYLVPPEVEVTRSPEGIYSFAYPNGDAFPIPADVQPYVEDKGLTSILEMHARAWSGLDESDRVVMRCFEASTTVPEEWIAYRKALRAATTSATVAPLPSRPEYPAGT